MNQHDKEVKGHLVQKLRSWHTDTHTRWTDCSAWTTKVVGNNINKSLPWGTWEGPVECWWHSSA